MENLNFSLNEVVKKYDQDKTNNLADPVNCKKYITDHVFPIRGGTFIVFEDGEAVNYDLDKLKVTYFNKIDKSLSTWFFTKYIEMFTIVCEIGKPVLYENKINLCAQFLHPKKDYNSYPAEIKAKVELWKSYLLDVISNGRRDVLDYLLNLYSKIAKGEKLDVCLYLRSPERCGKSFNTDFLIKHVFGRKLSIISNSEPLRTTYNKILLGKLLVIFEELETSSTKEWESISSRLKQMITGSTLMYSNKFEKAFESKNINNYIINTNCEAIQHSEGNRYFCIDVSTKHRADSNYFGHLSKICMNDEVGEAFYNYLLSIDTTNFLPQRDMPETNNKRDAIVDRLPTEFKFIKENYILKKLPIKSTVQELYDEYQTYCIGEDKKAYTKTRFCSKLREVGIEYSKSNSNNIYRVTCNDLMSIASKGKWIHELDEFQQPKTTVDPLDQGIKSDNDDIKHLKQTIEEQNKVIEQLKKQIGELTSKSQCTEEIVIMKPKKSKAKTSDKIFASFD